GPTMKLILTGAPRAGKTTLLKSLVNAYPGAAGGIISVALPNRGGFELQVVWKPPWGPLQVADRAVLARAAEHTPRRYGIDPEALSLAVRALDGAMHEDSLVIIDEIGPLQMASPEFQDAVLRCFDGPGSLIATLGQWQDPLVDGLRTRPGVRVVEVTAANRQHLAEALPKWLST
ncbi:MAG TPA: nucleoside-triphosphatase, partial [Symbiobacteriaceae bacterium]|nr:nucleoside-triphosphatase [Symbiobacteriaceae bacterium]